MQGMGLAWLSPANPFSAHTSTQLYRGYTPCLIRHGFREFIFITGRMGNSTALDVVAIEYTLGQSARIAMVEI